MSKRLACAVGSKRGLGLKSARSKQIDWRSIEKMSDFGASIDHRKRDLRIQKRSISQGSIDQIPKAKLPQPRLENFKKDYILGISCSEVGAWSMRSYIMILGFLILILGVTVAFANPIKTKLLHRGTGIQTITHYPYAMVGAIIALIGGVTAVIGYAVPDTSHPKETTG